MNSKRINEAGFTLTELIMVVFVWGIGVLGGGCGWVMNIIKLCHYNTLDVHAVIRMIGAVTFIPGAIMGWMNF